MTLPFASCLFKYILFTAVDHRGSKLRRSEENYHSKVLKDVPFNIRKFAI